MKNRVLFWALCVFICLSLILTGCDFLEAFGGLEPLQTFAPGEGELALHFIDVGQGDCILLQFPSGKYMLVDAGEENKGPTVQKYLTDKQIETLEAVVVTHPHTDHFGGMIEVVENKQFVINNLYMSVVPEDLTPTNRTYEKFLDAIIHAGLKAKAPKRDAVIYTEDNLSVTVLSDYTQEYGNLNNYSIVLKVVYQNTSFLLTGDAEKKVEQDLIAWHKNALEVDVLKVGHHGSSTSSHGDFVDMVNPSMGVIQLGKDNSYGFPHRETVQTFSQRQIPLVRNDINGTIVFYSDGQEITYTIENET